MAWDSNLERGTPAYRFAVDTSTRIRVVAGPGTGKSFSLQRRVARLLENGADPRKILAVTFTRAAAQDLKKEIRASGVEGAENVVAKTLHGYCFQILNKVDIITRTGRNPRPVLEFELNPMLHDLQGDFGVIKEKRNRIFAFEAAWARLQSEEPGFPTDVVDKAFQREVRRWLLDHKAMLFGEMIIEAYHYLKNNPMCAERNQFEHVLVDEYQDLNKADQAVIDLISSNCQLAIIGDDDQSIYSFRHAHPEGIRNFPQTHPGCCIIDFDFCRRCPKKVVRMASSLISHNENRTLGELHPYVDNKDGDVQIIQWQSLDAEINGLCNLIAKYVNTGAVNSEDILILVPRKLIGYRTRDVLNSLGVSAKSYFSEDALKTETLRRNFSLLNLLANPEDMVSLRFLLGQGATDFRTNSYSKILKYSKDNQMSIKDALDQLLSGGIKIPYTNPCVEAYAKIHQQLLEMKAILKDDRLKIVDLLSSEKVEDADFRRIILDAIQAINDENGEELLLIDWLKKIYNYTIEKISYPENVEVPDHVRIMTLHSSKGLSAKFVVVMSCIDGLIPCIDQKEGTTIEEQIEEQRRLFYVAITRCKSSTNSYPGTLIISSFVGLPGEKALQLGLYGKAGRWSRVNASRFISDFEGTAPDTIIPEEVYLET